MSSIAQTALPTLIERPRDEAAHEGLPWEIWWISAQIQAGERNFAVHTLINHMAGGLVYVGATVTDLDAEKEVTRHALLQPGEASIATDRLSIETGLSDLSGSYDDGYRFKGKIDDDTEFDLALRPTRPILYNGGGGQFRF